MINIGKHVYIISENPVFPECYQPRDFIFRIFKLNFNHDNYPVMQKEDVYRHQKEYLNVLEEINWRRNYKWN